MRWTGRHERAAHLVAEDRLTNAEIAAEVGVTRQALDLWKADDAFRSRVAALLAELGARLTAEGIASKDYQLRALQGDFDRTEQIVRERAAAARTQLADETAMVKPAPGAASGLMVKQFKPAKTRLGVVEEWAVDSGLMSERRALLKQALQVSGQWTEKRELTGKDGGPVAVTVRPDLTQLSDEELDALEHLVGKLAHAGGDTGGEDAAPLPS